MPLVNDGVTISPYIRCFRHSPRELPHPGPDLLVEPGIAPHHEGGPIDQVELGQPLPLLALVVGSRFFSALLVCWRGASRLALARAATPMPPSGSTFAPGKRSASHSAVPRSITTNRFGFAVLRVAGRAAHDGLIDGTLGNARSSPRRHRSRASSMKWKCAGGGFRAESTTTLWIALVARSAHEACSAGARPWPCGRRVSSLRSLLAIQRNGSSPMASPTQVTMRSSSLRLSVWSTSTCLSRNVFDHSSSVTYKMVTRWPFGCRS